MNLDADNSLSVQDTVHIGTKSRNAWLNDKKVFKIGSKIADPDHLRQLIGILPKSLHLLSGSDLDGKDRMNFKSVERIISKEVISHLDKIGDSEGTKFFLKALSMVMEPYLNKSLTPNQRIYNMAYGTFFFSNLEVKYHGG